MARPLRWLTERGFAGRVHPVNPKYDELGGRPLLALARRRPRRCRPRARPRARRAGGRRGHARPARPAPPRSSCSPPASPRSVTTGAARQEELVAAARASGTRVLGPNCQGLYDARSRLFATFTSAGERPLIGSSGIAYVGQSGAIGGAVLDVAAERGLDLTAWVSTGNEADVTLTEVGRHLVADPDIAVLTVYAESLPDPGGYAALAAEAQATGTALVVLRSGPLRGRTARRGLAHRRDARRRHGVHAGVAPVRRRARRRRRGAARRRDPAARAGTRRPGAASGSSPARAAPGSSPPTGRARSGLEVPGAHRRDAGQARPPGARLRRGGQPRRRHRAAVQRRWRRVRRGLRPRAAPTPRSTRCSCC